MDAEIWAERGRFRDQPVNELLGRAREILRIRLSGSAGTANAEIAEHDHDGPYPHHGPRYIRRLPVDELIEPWLTAATGNG